MKHTLITLMALFLFLPLVAADKDKPLPKDFKSLKALAEKGDAEAQARLATIYSSGKGVKVDKIEAFKWASLSAKQGNPIAKYQVAGAHHGGVTIPQDTAKAEVLWKEAAPGLLALAKQGNAYAQYCLGEMYEDGKVINRNEKEGFQWMLKAAKQNLPEAQCAVFTVYALGKGVKKDEKEGLIWLRKAAEQNFPDAKVAIGMLQIVGKMGVKKNAAKGLQLLQESVEQGSAGGMYFLGGAYISEENAVRFGVDQDIEKGVGLIRASANLGFPMSRYLLARMYLFGALGVKQDNEDGVKLLRTAAAQGDPDAQFMLAQIKFVGRFGVEKDFKSGQALLRKAVEQGYPEAQHLLATIYFNGQFGEEEDNVLAYVWAHIAATNKHVKAKQNKEGTFAFFLTAAQIDEAEKLVKEMVKKNPKLLNKK